jgi:hypothetical protein
MDGGDPRTLAPEADLDVLRYAISTRPTRAEALVSLEALQ